MLLLGATVYAGINGVDPDQSLREFALVWLAVLALMMAMVIVAIADLRLTMQMRNAGKAGT